MSLKGKIALVTGASRGIGRAIAETLASRGATVIGTATSQSGITTINSYLGKSGTGMHLDISNDIAIDIFFKKMLAEFGDTDILVNNAGIRSDNLLMRMTKDEWHSILNTNLTSLFYMSKAVMRAMIKKRYGRIITIGSVIGASGNAGQVNYAAAKAGIVGFSKSLAREVASRCITVNVIAPGFISTEMTQTLTDEYRADILSQIPANRFGYSKEIAYAVAFLSSEEAGYITGETIHVNGGMYML
ncbi:3-oxoacyl-(acyl-carrier-protein) reductase [secondary endosymbiont of Heteropsylla cubana]|uniref:3-oxoacyl-[acyl-carrier-protein] reductase n=1 Tax=secondary endosymbiont of Heteropsylla cubana TaxID=134287 RepID=J7H0L7_9ENTR|nr:3-oxoacyl-ACP reductase FabG [secondary endosymbiont of Heteropsylla cubana]AFP85860.1 3-oxoacyl-(acyl-carrier-protein) reductase [secondary endosymbiont of Heteropsylla cubana]